MAASLYGRDHRRPLMLFAQMMQGVHEVFAQERFIDDRGPSWLAATVLNLSRVSLETEQAGNVIFG